MTISLAWVRRAGKTPELVFASDSRLSGGGHVDQCQKVFSLPREDCCIAFAGHTTIAYPFILQLQNSILEFKKSMDRAVDVTNLNSRIVEMLNSFVRSHENTVTSDFREELIATSFIFGGWSWRNSKFYIWVISYNPAVGAYVAGRASASGILGLPSHLEAEFALIGDYRRDYLKLMRDKVKAKVNYSKKYNSDLDLNYEPLQVLSEMLLSPEFTDRRSEKRGAIGGSPQLIKVFPYMKALPYAVEWEVNEKFVYAIKGRVISDFEIFTIPGIDPIAGVVRAPVRGRSDEDQVDPNLEAALTSTDSSEVQFEKTSADEEGGLA